jgi:hypothetical protein
MAFRRAATRATVAGTLAFSGWQGSVLYFEQQREARSNQRTPQKTRFFLGSTDDLIKDSLEPGDVVFFSHPWYLMRPAAACRTLASQLCGDSFDHCGVVVRRGRFAEPEVLEWTDSGVKLTAYDKRVLMSCATSLWVRHTRPVQLRRGGGGSGGGGGAPPPVATGSGGGGAAAAAAVRRGGAAPPAPLPSGGSNSATSAGADPVPPLSGDKMLRGLHTRRLIARVDSNVATHSTMVDVSGDEEPHGTVSLVRWLASKLVDGRQGRQCSPDPAALLVTSAIAAALAPDDDGRASGAGDGDAGAGGSDGGEGGGKSAGRHEDNEAAAVAGRGSAEGPAPSMIADLAADFSRRRIVVLPDGAGFTLEAGLPVRSE